MLCAEMHLFLFMFIGRERGADGKMLFLLCCSFKGVTHESCRGFSFPHRYKVTEELPACSRGDAGSQQQHQHTRKKKTVSKVASGALNLHCC